MPPSERTIEVPQDAAALKALVDGYMWHHQIDLGRGVITPGKDHSALKLRELQLPSLEGKSVLDVGAWDGYFSFAAERLGASRVVALDSVIWHNISKEPFEIARKALGSNVEDVELEVLEINPEAVGKFDVVLFMGVLYHMRDPLAALEAVASVTSDLLVVETLVDMTYSRRPAAAFYPGTYFGGDYSNWWGPNAPAAIGMIEEFGFKDVKAINKPGAFVHLYRTTRNLLTVGYSRMTSKLGNLPLGYATTDRLIIHARR
jgi:tRNA (mo5U34)-methyltransferase